MLKRIFNALFGPSSPACMAHGCGAAAEHAAADGGSGGFCEAHKDH